eukprot:3745728-Pyramimonas_sp.AAC.1
MEVRAVHQYASAEAHTIDQHIASQRGKEWRERLKQASKGSAGFIHRISKWAKAPPAPYATTAQ